jgi:hypothetical protein
MSNTSDFLSGAGFMAAASKEMQLKVIDISDKPLKSNVVRQGRQVPAVALDPRAVDAILGPEVIITPGQAPRVVSQSIPPGTKVARGAGVDISLAPRSTIPIDVIVGFHPDFRGKNVGGVVEVILANRQVSDAVLDFDNAADVPAATRAVIEQTLTTNQVGINNDDPTRSFEAAFLTLKGVAAFK